MTRRRLIKDRKEVGGEGRRERRSPGGWTGACRAEPASSRWPWQDWDPSSRLPCPWGLSCPMETWDSVSLLTLSYFEDFMVKGKSLDLGRCPQALNVATLEELIIFMWPAYCEDERRCCTIKQTNTCPLLTLHQPPLHFPVTLPGEPSLYGVTCEDGLAPEQSPGLGPSLDSLFSPWLCKNFFSVWKIEM